MLNPKRIRAGRPTFNWPEGNPDGSRGRRPYNSEGHGDRAPWQGRITRDRATDLVRPLNGLGVFAADDRESRRLGSVRLGYKSGKGAKQPRTRSRRVPTRAALEEQELERKHAFLRTNPNCHREIANGCRRRQRLGCANGFFNSVRLGAKTALRRVTLGRCGERAPAVSAPVLRSAIDRAGGGPCGFSTSTVRQRGVDVRGAVRNQMNGDGRVLGRPQVQLS